MLKDDATAIAGCSCYIAAAAALAAARYRFERPSHDEVLDAGLMMFSFAGVVWLQLWSHLLHPGHGSVALTFGLPVIACTLVLRVGVRRRTHAPLLAGLAFAAGALFQLSRMFELIESRLLFAGSIGLAAGICIDRYLRTERNGIYAKRADHDLLDDIVEANFAATIATSSSWIPAHGAGVAGAPSDAPAQSNGGQFGGGGASGKY